MTAWHSEAGAAPGELWPKPHGSNPSVPCTAKMLLTLKPASAFKSLIHTQPLSSRLELPTTRLCHVTELEGTGSYWIWRVLVFSVQSWRPGICPFVRRRLKCLNGVKWDTSFCSAVQIIFYKASSYFPNEWWGLSLISGMVALLQQQHFTLHLNVKCTPAKEMPLSLVYRRKIQMKMRKD